MTQSFFDIRESYQPDPIILEGMDQKKFSAGAKAMKAYAQKNGGVDKKDFMEVSKLLDQIGRVNILQAGQLLSRLNRLVDGMDTDVRERIFVELKKVGLVESVNESNYGTQAQRLMSPLQKARQDKEKRDRDRDGKLKSTALPRRKKKNEEAELDEGSETWEAGFKRRVVKTTKPEHKEKGYNWRIKGKDRPEISIKLYKNKPDFAEFKKQMKRVAGHEFGG